MTGRPDPASGLADSGASLPVPATAADPRWPFPQGPTAADEVAESKVLNLADAFIAESHRVRSLQFVSLALAGGIAVLLVVLLFCVVKVGFHDHLGKAEEMLIKVADRPWTPLSIAPSATLPSSNGETLGFPVAPSGASPAGPPAGSPAATPSVTVESSLELAAAERKTLHDLLATGLKSLAYSTVAVVSILVVAICIMTLGVAKVVFAMTPHRLTENSKSNATNDKSGQSSSDLVLPNLEFAKEFTKLFVDLVKHQKA